ncbi:acetylcholine receptor subunit alpha-1-B [Biomphalaria glabrata]|nr:acetylcholine receptor subunit alpha-1-B-like [Biomphalaria glabrata]
MKLKIVLAHNLFCILAVCSQTTYMSDVTDTVTTGYAARNWTKSEAFQTLRTEMNDRLLARQKAPPKYYSSHDSDIAISFDPLQIIDVVGMSQAMTLTSIVTLKWRDPEIMWEPSMYAGIVDIQLPSDNLWSPSVIVPKSSENEDLNIEFPELVKVNYKGYIIAFIPTFITTLCTMDMTYFPFDEHNCTVVFLESSFYNITSFVLPPTDIQSHFGTHGEWIMDSHWCTSNITHMTPPFSYVTCYIEMSRCSLFFVLNLIGPMAMTSAMTLVVFWIPAKSGEKIGYVLSMYTSTSVFLSFIVERIPKNMDTTLPRINILLLAIVIQVILATVATTIVLKRYNKEINAKKSGKTLCKRPALEAKPNVDNCEKPNKVQLSTKPTGEQTSVDKDTLDNVHIIYSGQLHNNCPNNDINKNVDGAKKNANESACEKEISIYEADQIQTGSNTSPDEQDTSRCMTHDELDKLFFAVLTTLTVVMYIVVYLY